jgi:triphosphoribosyl-dephospho-CoA synthetase
MHIAGYFLLLKRQSSQRLAQRLAHDPVFLSIQPTAFLFRRQGKSAAFAAKATRQNLLSRGSVSWSAARQAFRDCRTGRRAGNPGTGR